jgi:3D (Asp-Asp-Asp) domain-containing protein
LATDKSVIRHGLAVTAQSAPGNWGILTYVADDIGSAIIGKHIDIYCGVGAAAYAETLTVTSNSGRVCYTGAAGQEKGS